MEEIYSTKDKQVKYKRMTPLEAEEAAKRREEESRRAQNEDLERQLKEHFDQENTKRTHRRKIGLSVAVLLCAMYVTGVVVDAADVAKQAIPKDTPTPIGIHETIKNKLLGYYTKITQ